MASASVQDSAADSVSVPPEFARECLVHMRHAGAPSILLHDAPLAPAFLCKCLVPHNQAHNGALMLVQYALTCLHISMCPVPRWQGSAPKLSSAALAKEPVTRAAASDFTPCSVYIAWFVCCALANALPKLCAMSGCSPCCLWCAGPDYLQDVLHILPGDAVKDLLAAEPRWQEFGADPPHDTSIDPTQAAAAFTAAVLLGHMPTLERIHSGGCDSSVMAVRTLLDS